MKPNQNAHKEDHLVNKAPHEKVESDNASNTGKTNAEVKQDPDQEKQPGKSKKKPNRLSRFFDRFANKVTVVTGSPWAFIFAFIVIIVWAVSGPIFGYSDTWQLVINTGTTIVTFLMVFVIQQSQNKDTMALQLKLNELIASNKRASNRLIDVEDLTEEELKIIKDYYVRLSTISKKEKELRRSHSIEDLETSEIDMDEEDNNDNGRAGEHKKEGAK